MKTLCLFAITLTMTLPCWASRELEVEDYFSKKATHFIQTRYPGAPFTVMVRVDTGQSQQRRQAISEKDPKVLNLPYLEFSENPPDNLWSRTDVSLAQLISYVRRLDIDVEIDAPFAENELEEFRQQLFKYLKLSPSFDELNVRKMSWVKKTMAPRSIKDYALIGGVAFLLLIFLMGLSRLSIRQLVKGLSQPLSEIGKNTASLQPGGLPPKLSTIENLETNSTGTSYLSSDALKEWVAENPQDFAQPTAQTMAFLELWGERHPRAMGRLFAELEVNVVRNLVRWGQGEWWETAITQPGGSQAEVDRIIGELGRLKMRRRLEQEGLNKDESEPHYELELALGRLPIKTLGKLLKDHSIEKVGPLLRRLPKEKMIHCAKYLYPGQWAQLLEQSAESELVSPELAEQLFEGAVQALPLREDKQIQRMFSDADLVRYLNETTTKDERELYRMLPKDSKVARQRKPFYQVFECDPDLLESLSQNIPLSSWALAFRDCERSETVKLFQFFTDRQKFQIRTHLDQIKASSPSNEQVVGAKRQILEQFSQHLPDTIEDSEHDNEAV